MIKIKIQSIEYFLPKKTVSNNALKIENPSWDFSKINQKVGVLSRQIAQQDETALDLAHQACLRIFKKKPELKDIIDAIVFCTQSGDYIMPSNACLLHQLLGLKDNVFATDYNLACSGYIYGLALAQGLIVAGTAKNVLLVTGDTYS